MRQETRILVVDDSTVILELVKHVLQSAGYLVWTALSGDEALALIKQRGLPNLAIVDINMPGMDGFAFCSQLHRFSDVPVIMLSSEGREDVVVQSLTHHAEDYIVKPADGILRVEELKARVSAVLNRVGDVGYHFVDQTEIDDRLSFALNERAAYVHGERIRLSPTETKFLHLLLRHAGRPLSYSYLLGRLWPLEEAFEDRLHTCVYRLRRKLESDPRAPRYIVSEWGKGYRFPAATELEPLEDQAG